MKDSSVAAGAAGTTDVGRHESIDFVRDSPTPDTFDGGWQVWVGSRRFGIVRKASTPTRWSEPWGYSTVPFGPYPNGQTCYAGFRTRLAAAEHLIAVVGPADAASVPHHADPLVSELDQHVLDGKAILGSESSDG